MSCNSLRGLKRFVRHDLSALDPKLIYALRLDLRGAAGRWWYVPVGGI